MGLKDYFKKLKCICEQQYSCYTIILEIKFTYLLIKIDSILNRTDKDFDTVLKKEYIDYLRNLYSEIDIYNYAFKILKEIYIDDMILVFDKLDEQFSKRSNYIDSVMENHSIAVSIGNLDRLYLPIKHHFDLDLNKIDIYRNQLCGFNDHSLKNFMIFEGIYSDELIKKEIKKLRSDNNKKFGNILGNECLDLYLPEVTDDISMMNNIHNLIINVLLIEYKDNIHYGNDLALFYQLLYKSNNPFVKSNLKTSNISQILLKEYKEEPFLEQIEKVKFYSKEYFV